MAQSTQPVTVLAGRYALDEPLGRSRTGMVWRAQDMLLRRTVVVKLVHPRLADDPAFASALETQARRVAGLSASGVARLLDTGTQDGVPFLVREHAGGSSVRARLARGPLPVEEAVRIAEQVSRALAGVHERGVLHLSLDVDDVIVADDGTIRVTDLVIAAALTSSRAADGPALFGAERVAPEQVAGRPVDERTDVFAIGALLFEMLTGERPGERRSMRRVRPEVPRTLDRIVAHALDPDPDRRFPNASALAQALARSDDDRVVELPEAPRGGNLFAWVGVPLLVAGVAAVVIAAGLWVGRLEVGGPLGVRPARDRPVATAATPTSILPVVAVAIDPFGDGDELSSNAALAVDGDRATAWRSEDYFDGELGKPGIGLLLDLGRRMQVMGLRLWTPHPGFSFGVAIGDDPAALVGGGVEDATSAPVTQVLIEGTGRYVLVWISSVVPVEDGNRAEVSEVRVVVGERRAGRG